MSNPHNTEPQANYELARALRRRNPDWTDRTCGAERTRVIQQALPGSGAAKRPDILVSSPRRQPVIVETGVATKWWTLEGAAEGSNSVEGGTMVA